MGVLVDDTVVIKQSEKEGEPVVITVNCPDKTGLGCDLCRVILLFGLNVVRADASTDGKWCYLVFWVIGKPSTRWGLLKKRLMDVCPSCSLASSISYFRDELLQDPRVPQLFLLKLCSCVRHNLLHDVAEVLCELELTVERVKVSTTPDGKVMDLFFITDNRELLHTPMRKKETYDQLRGVLGDGMISCEIELASSEITSSSQGPSFLSDEITEAMFNAEVNDLLRDYTPAFLFPSVVVDNSLSPSHTLIQITCQDHKGLVYDVMRTFKDYNIQLQKGEKEYEMELFIVQSDGKKLLDQGKQNSLCCRLQLELCRPVRITSINRGPDTQLLVANPVELSGKGRPNVFYDITRALKVLNRPIFSGEIWRYMIGGREWEVYSVLLDEAECDAALKRKIEDTVWQTLVYWE